MTIPQGKRRRTDGGVSPGAGAEGDAAAADAVSHAPGAGAEGTASASHAALSAAVRASLSEAAAAAALAASARTEAAEVTARSMEEMNAAAVRSMAACQAPEDAAVKAVASASALARGLGIEADDGDDVAARDVEGVETALLSEGALGDGNGDGGVAAQMSETASASKGAQGGGGNGGFTIFHLPDAIIEKLFDLVGAAELRDDEEKGGFPCRPALARFALSCRRFARLFRGSYVTNIQFDAIFRFAKDARDYREVVSGALSRFPNACSVTVINFDCFPWPGSSEFGTLVWAQEEANYALNESRELDFRLAAADQSAMAEAVAGRIGDCTGGATVKRLCFEEHDGYPQSRLAPGSVSWKGECARWLDYLPNVTDLFCKDFEVFCNSSRSCGANLASLKALGIQWDADCDYGVPGDAYLLSFLQFRDIETLVIRVENFDGDPAASELELLMLPRVLELLPKLDDFGILLANNNKLLVDGTMPPLLQSLFRNPSLPVEGRCKLRVHVGIFDFYDFDDVEHTSKALRTCITGDSLPEWEVTEEQESATLFRNIMGPFCYVNVAALAVFRPTPSSM